MALYLRPALLCDAPVIARIKMQSHHAAHDDLLFVGDPARLITEDTEAARYENDIKKNNGHIYLLLEGDQPQAFACWGKPKTTLFHWPDPEEEKGWAELTEIYVLPDKWRNHYGSQLLTHCLSEMQKIGYKNIIAMAYRNDMRSSKFFQAHGFHWGGETSGYSSTPKTQYTRVI